VIEPIDIVVFCPACDTQHIDAEDRCAECPGGSCMCVKMAERWTNPPHRSHLCAFCGHVWRPADVPTNGVATVKTRGERDSDLMDPRDRHQYEISEQYQAGYNDGYEHGYENGVQGSRL
jgi:hypothetical protein